jgi:hypothetical protein
VPAEALFSSGYSGYRGYRVINTGSPRNPLRNHTPFLWLQNQASLDASLRFVTICNHMFLSQWLRAELVFKRP